MTSIANAPDLKAKYAAALDAIDSKDAEIKRLREALKAIDAAAFNDNGDITYNQNAMRCAFFKARAALNPEDEV